MIKNETLAHDASMGEVDPRSYPLLGLLRFKSAKIGSHERLSQVSRLHRAIDNISTAEGDRHARVHLTLAPGMDAKKSVEVRLQPLTLPSDAERESFIRKVKARWNEILDQGVQGGWEKVEA